MTKLVLSAQGILKAGLRLCSILTLPRVPHLNLSFHQGPPLSVQRAKSLIHTQDAWEIVTGKGHFNLIATYTNFPGENWFFV